MKKDNMITVFYDEVTRKDIYRLNGVDVTDTIEILKDKWERQILDTRCRLFQLDMSIQQRLQEWLALTEKALELAVSQLDDAKDMLRECGKRDWAGMIDTSVDYFKARAKENLKSE